MFKRILLVPVSDSPDQACVQRVLALAGRATAVEVYALAHEPHLDGYFGHPEIYESLRTRLVADREAVAGVIAARLREHGVTATAKAVWDAPRHEALARAAQSFHADLVVTELKTTERGLASGEWRTVAACPVPLLAVRGDGRGPYRNIVAAVDPFHAHGKPAELDAVILEQATALRALSGAALKVVHAYLPLTEFLPRAQLEHIQAADADRVIEQARRDSLNELVKSAGLAADDAELIPGRPAAVLEAQASGSEADLLILGAWSRGRLRDLFLGSTAERVLAQRGADVLIVKPRQDGDALV
jgi:universal stress protein E